MSEPPLHQIRALYDEHTIRVYQAYSDTIADSALAHRTFVSPPFKMERMTWIKPSFLWMMYRSGWGQKDAAQKRILAIDITRDGFDWALVHSCLSHFEKGRYATYEEWQRIKEDSPVRIQWDPERDIHLQPLPYRTIQIGLSAEAVTLYATSWIQSITDVTPLAHDIHALVNTGRTKEAQRMLPHEEPYQPSAYHP